MKPSMASAVAAVRMTIKPNVRSPVIVAWALKVNACVLIYCLEDWLTSGGNFCPSVSTDRVKPRAEPFEGV
jgi:hypothetical protein